MIVQGCRISRVAVKGMNENSIRKRRGVTRCKRKYGTTNCVLDAKYRVHAEGQDKPFEKNWMRTFGAGRLACGFLLAFPGLLPFRLQFVPLTLQCNQAMRSK